MWVILLVYKKTAVDANVRFALVTTFYPPFNFGGDGIFVRQLARELVAGGHSVEVVHCVDAYRTLAREEPAATDTDSGVMVHRLESGVGPLSPLGTHQTGRPVFKARRLREILRRDFDVIHFHNVSLVGGPALFELGGAFKLLTAHDYWLLCPTHLLHRYDGTPCTERRCLRCQLAHRRPVQAWRHTNMITRALEHVDLCLAPSRFAARRHERELGRPFTYLPNFVPEESTGGPSLNDKAPGRRASDMPYVLYVGRLEAAKGVDPLVRFFIRRGKEKLLVAGAGSQADTLARLARGTPWVELLGHVSHSVLPDLYKRALALIVPSRCYEVCPLVILEAFRAGVAVLVRDVGSLPELVEGGRGLVYRDDNELAHHLERLQIEPALGRALGRRGRRAWETTFSPQAHMRHYLEIIESAGFRHRPAREVL